MPFAASARMDRFSQDFKVALRALARQRGFTTVAVVTLALGVGATTAIFSIVYGVLLRPLPYAAASELVHLGQTSRSDPAEPVDGSSSRVNFLDWQRAARTVAPMALYSGGRAVISHEGEADVVRIGSVTQDFFSVFRATPIVGRGFTPEEERPSGPRAVVVSYGFWQERLGGRADVLGQTVEISGVPWPIVGVAPRGFDFPRAARLWLPVRNDDAQCGRSCVNLNGIGRLAAGATLASAQQEMTAIAAALEREYPADNTDVTVMVQSLRDRFVGSVRLALVVLLASVVMVLLIACANVANLVIVRGRSRHSEMAVRAALGAGRRGLIRYLLIENLLLSIAGGGVGLLLSLWGISALKAAAPANLPRLDDVAFDLPTFAFALLVVSLTTLLFGLGPSLQLSRVPLAGALGQRGTIDAGGGRFTRTSLLAAEVALSVVLLLGAGLLLRSLSALEREEPGFDARGLTQFTVSLPPARYPAAEVVAAHERLDEALTAIPGVSRVARISGLPLGSSENVFNFARPDRPAPPPGQAPIALYRVVDAEYFATMKIAIASGRAFLPTDREGAPPVAIISRRMADQFWPGEDPVGRPLQVGTPTTRTIVGVAANVRSQTLAQQSQPELYVPHAQTTARTVTYVVESALPAAQLLPAARAVARRFDARLPLLDAGAVGDLVDAELARPRFYLLLLGLFSVLAVVLAAVGVYGVVAYIVSQRTREIGVRMALGASRGQVVSLMVWQGLRPAIAGLTVGVAAAAAAGQAIAGLLYEVRPHDPATFMAAAALVLVVVAVACALPARRAAAIAPVEALRGE